MKMSALIHSLKGETQEWKSDSTPSSGELVAVVAVVAIALEGIEGTAGMGVMIGVSVVAVAGRGLARRCECEVVLHH